MTSKNTTNFIFLKEVRPELYELTVKMERDLLIAPISMFAYATRFLEYILHDIADENNYDVNTKVGYVDKVNQLIRFDYLDNTLHNNLPQLLIDAYNERSYSIHSHDLEKSLREDENTAFRLNETLFYIADAYYMKITGKDEKHVYVKPQKIKTDPDEKIYESNLVNESKKGPVKTVKIAKKDLKEEQLVKSDQLKNSHEEITNDEKQGFVQHVDLQNSRIYDESAISKFVELLEKGYSQQNALKHVDVNQTILNDWYMDKKSEFLEGYKDDLFVKYNELLIENTIKLIAENKSVGSNGQKLEFWIQNFGEFIDNHAQNLAEDQLKVFQMMFKRNTSKKAKGDKVVKQSDKIVSVKPQIGEVELEKRKQLMLEYIERFNFNVSLKKSRLSPIEVQKSKKEFLNGKRKNFYYELSQKLMAKYLISRKNGKSTEEFCREFKFDRFEIDFWIENDLFKDFQFRYNKIRMLLFKQAMESNKNQEEVLDILEMDGDEFIELVQLINDDVEYIGVRQIVKQHYYPYSLEAFMNEFRENPNIEIALKKSNLRKEDLETSLNLNKSLYDEFMQIQMDEIVKSKIYNENVDLNRLGMTQEKYSQVEKEVNERVVDKQIKKITNGMSEGMLLVTASNVGCDMDTVFDWILKGSAGNNEFSELANKYWGIHIKYVNSLNSNGNPNLRVSQNNLEIFGLNNHIDYWKEWGLINNDNGVLSVLDVKRILRGYLVNDSG